MIKKYVVGVLGALGMASLLSSCEEVATLTDTLNDTLKNVEETKLYDIEEVEVFRPEYTVYTGEVERISFEGTTICDMDVNLGGGSLLILPSDEDTIVVEGTEVEAMQTFVEDGTFYLTALLNKNITDRMKITVKVPQDKVFSNVKLNVGAGYLEGGRIVTKTGEVHVGAGAMTCGMECFDLMDVSCDAGNLDLTLIGKKEEYKCDISVTAGNVNYEDENVSIVNRKVFNEDGEREILINCRAGNVNLKFADDTLGDTMQ